MGYIEELFLTCLFYCVLLPVLIQFILKKKNKSQFFNPLVGKMYAFFPEPGKCSTLDFFCCFLFIKVSFCLQYFHINLSAFEFGQESEKGQTVALQ